MNENIMRSASCRRRSSIASDRVKNATQQPQEEQIGRVPNQRHILGLRSPTDHLTYIRNHSRHTPSEGLLPCREKYIPINDKPRFSSSTTNNIERIDIFQWAAAIPSKLAAIRWRAAMKKAAVY